MKNWLSVQFFDFIPSTTCVRHRYSLNMKDIFFIPQANGNHKVNGLCFVVFLVYVCIPYHSPEVKKTKLKETTEHMGVVRLNLASKVFCSVLNVPYILLFFEWLHQMFKFAPSAVYSFVYNISQVTVFLYFFIWAR